uniref:Uncharacterized protein n=1 Tax=Arundo donax TaxID=35708 RepID=A0A0A9EMP7_ARUDO
MCFHYLEKYLVFLFKHLQLNVTRENFGM